MGDLEQVVRNAEEKLGLFIPDSIAANVFQYAKRKCEVVGQPIEYLPILFENEITDYFLRLAVNMKGEENYVSALPPNTVPSQMSQCRTA